MDRTKIIELAKEWLTENEWHEGDSEADEQAELADLLGSGIPEMMTDFALSLLKWKSVADGLPEVDAIYPVIDRGSRKKSKRRKNNDRSAKNKDR